MEGPTRSIRLPTSTVGGCWRLLGPSDAPPPYRRTQLGCSTHIAVDCVDAAKCGDAAYYSTSRTRLRSDSSSAIMAHMGLPAPRSRLRRFRLRIWKNRIFRHFRWLLHMAWRPRPRPWSDFGEASQIYRGPVTLPNPGHCRILRSTSSPPLARSVPASSLPRLRAATMLVCGARVRLHIGESLPSLLLGPGA